MIYRKMFEFPVRGFEHPFGELERMRQQMNRLVSELSGDVFRARPAGVFPLVNLTEDREHYYVRAELPGIQANELDIQADGKSLSLSGKREIDPEQNGVKYHRREREGGKFSRVLSLPGEINPAKIEAKLSDGILKIVIPKAESVKPRKITIA